MSRKTIDDRRISINNTIESLPNDVIKLKILGAVGVLLTTVEKDAILNGVFSGGSNIDIELNVKLDLVEEIIQYFISGTDLPSSGGGGVVNNIIEDTTTSRILAMDDAQKYIRFSNIGEITITIPLDTIVSFEIGTEIEFEQSGSGIIKIKGDIGVTIISFGDAFDSMGQYSTIRIKKVATNEWIITGMVV